MGINAPAALPSPLTLVIAGVAGSGKSTVAQLLADRIGGHCLDADAYHPVANVAKMQAGIPLDDADRWPWLERMNAILREGQLAGERTCLACSALRGIYRERLLAGLSPAVLIALEGSPELLAARLAARQGHFMPAALLASQLATWEAPAEAMRINITEVPEVLVARILAQLPNFLRH